MKKQIKKYKAAVYVRLSKEDAANSDSGKTESDSISNQKALITNFVKGKSDITIVDYYVDDGYTGVIFERPEFIRMLSDINENKINCVIVKDLSRFGREYINAGRYMQKLFPTLQVRFIAINDNYDSLKCDDQTNEIIIPIKNLVNDGYCRDISIKIRSVLEAKRQNGEFVSNYCPYGYKKCADDHNKIEPDEFSGKVVQDIFKMIIEGYSLYKIADKLNAMGIKSPMDYRLENGEKINTAFKKNDTAVWSHNTVKRIVKNPVYIGTLIQGKVTTPNYKLKNDFFEKSKEEWAVVENNHEPLVNERIFDIVQRLLSVDMRISPKQEILYTFSGLAFCGDCGALMTRKVSKVGGKEYAYYMCSNHKKNKLCTSHRIKENLLEERVLETIRSVIEELVAADEVIKNADKYLNESIDMKKLQERISANNKEIERTNYLLAELYEDYKSGLLEKNDFLIIKKEYETKRNTALNAIEHINTEIEKSKEGKINNSVLVEEYKKYRNIAKLTRTIAVYLIYRINVYENDILEIEFNGENQIKNILARAETIKQSKALSERRVI